MSFKRRSGGSGSRRFRSTPDFHWKKTRAITVPTLVTLDFSQHNNEGLMINSKTGLLPPYIVEEKEVIIQHIVAVRQP